MSVHENKKEVFECNHCGKKFVEKGNKKKHIATVHEGKGKSTCKLCNKMLAGPTVLKRHIAFVHDKVKKFKCDLCDR